MLARALTIIPNQKPLTLSGIESVLQTASLVKSWHDIRKAYIFLALTVGIVTPLIALFALSSKL